MNCRNQPEPEPSPHWTNATRLNSWFILFECHNYFFASCFGILLLYSLFALFSNARTSFKKHFCIAINILLCLLGLCRMLYLILDPYESANVLQRHGNETSIPLVITRILNGITYPCLSSAFTLIFMAILKCTQIKVISPRFKNPILIYTIITIHFSVVLFVDITTVFCSGAITLMIICQSFFIAWGSIIGISYLYCCYKITTYNYCNHATLRLLVNTHKNPTKVKAVQDRLVKATCSRNRDLSDQTVPFVTPTIRKVVKVTMITACLGFIAVGLNCYSLFGIYSILSSDNIADPWPWLIYQSLFRTTELLMATTMAYTVTRPVKLKVSAPQPNKTNLAWK